MAPIDTQKMEEIAQSVVDAHRAFYVGLAERRERGRRVLQVFVDTDEGITIAECAEISRELGAKLDTQSVINEPYELEVSSPGIDKPLKLLRQYTKNVGRKYSVDYWLGNERKSFKGKLASVEGEQVTFTDDEDKPVTLEFSKIIESIEELPW